MKLSKNNHNLGVISLDSTLKLLSNITDKNSYFYWLNHQEYPPKSYLEHPIKSEKELQEYKNYFKRNFDLSLGAYIRIKRIFFILNNTKNQAKNELFYSFLDTPIGEMVAIFTLKGLCLLEFLDRKMLETELKEIIKKRHSNLINQKTEYFFELEQQLTEYFSGKREEFDIPLDFIGTDFQISVWQYLLNIPFGKTVSYSQQAKQMNIPNSTRAVASANGKNKISILVPCHRVLRQDHSLGGYGGGIARKKYLIELETF
ncbi:methylated-DNA--[protein]-cysteine S-methyltransferase [Muribacter muris]|uniref:methylated-DNA--[protein]-cysteine S-methyltransferase n=1 Tax=Muribacter muris TaxID=67855 RepID=A0A4Y9JTW9_9PAST|nr:methylated-DNA--[protein]-cysteine S-methyltransferase [Muribacter muris]MBF0786031.1 methylated-DNA--[protein]-cysteine S-methyltransferase [Muribacter muris]MBF0826791.1 methylated-DNA--[protein]-cysteine S-methyltransferase [Muribacter muris]TFV08160.1 methylated-DNA--[protein]-cysteine S-methyltransferase [Muribacter muris]